MRAMHFRVLACLVSALMAAAPKTAAQSGPPAAVNGFYDIKPPADAPVTLDLGDVTVTTYSPVTMTPVENSTNLYFVAKNNSATSRTLQFLSFTEISNTKPSWLFAFFQMWGFGGAPGAPSNSVLAPGESRTLEFYFSKDVAGGPVVSVTLPFRFNVLETARSGNLPITFFGDDGTMDWKRTQTATIKGRVTAAGQPLANALVNVALINQQEFVSTRTDASGNYSFGVMSIDDIRTIIGTRPLPYRSVDYFVTVESDGYKLGYRAGLTPAKGQSLTADFTLSPAAQRAAYTKVGEIATDGKLSYWWTRFAGPANDRVVSVQGQHPPVQPGTGHIIAVDLKGQQLWRTNIGEQCWGLDVSNDGLLVAAGCDNGKAYVFTYDGVLKWSANIGDRPGGGAIEDVRFSPDGTKLLVDGGAGAGGGTSLTRTGLPKLRPPSLLTAA